MSKADSNFITVIKASELCGIGPQTLRKLADEGKVKSYRTFSGQRRFDREDLLKMCNTIHDSESKQAVQGKNNYIYTRVSSKKQSNDLERQLEYIRSKDPKYSSYTSIQDIGSGINFQRKGLQEILDSCLQRTIGELVIA